MIKRLQLLLQWLFLRVEAVFNAAFGDKLNPLYHLGAITFFLFWLVAASGLYLYAFFETGVAQAYASVEHLTHGQWYAGGILRSVHRYASDAMALTMLLHLLRHFAFDRLRGFRWFSWVTGVALIWLVYVSGINGYMLPWDKLAQFVVVATFEWLDWIPIFGGVLTRNFIYQASVSDRFFSLLSFIHIGVPLVLLMLMWIHTQRVPRARTNPPRPIMFALSGALVALSLIEPALSQGGAADFGVTVTTLDFDWFYLPVYPLLYLWPLGQVWALVAGVTALLVALPWLPPKLRRGEQRDLQVSVHPDGRTLSARRGETLLEAGLRQGIALPYECRNGACGVCKCTVLNGRVDAGVYQPSALSAAERESGLVLMCCAVPLQDVEIEYATENAPAPSPAREYVGRVARMERLTHDVMRVLVELPPGENIPFQAGQYVNVILDDGQRRAFSFANPPHESEFLEMQIRLVAGGRFTSHVFEGMKVGDAIRFEGPLGDFVLRESNRPIIFVAGATGFAPVKSMVEDAFRKGIRRPIFLYWGVRKRRDLYLPELAERWQREHDNFKFIPVLSEPGPEDQWTGRTGLVHEAILADFPALGSHEIYACGSVRMVEAVFPALKVQGAEDGMCFSDAFQISGRSLALQPPAQ